MAVLTASNITIAHRQAEGCFRANTKALRAIQPALAEAMSEVNPTPSLEWVFGRDGSLTARIDEQWLGGCSIPKAAADQLLRSLDLRCSSGCFLNPTHAAQLRVTLDRTRTAQALLALVEDPQALWLMLHCVDFSADLELHRLWFVLDIETGLENLLQEHVGLAVPGQFIRTALTDQIEQRIATARRSLERASRQRAQRLTQWANAPAIHTGDRTPRCIVAGSAFDLWHGASAALWEAMDAGQDDVPLVRCDPDDPASASAAALAQAAADSRGIVAANLGRGDFPSLMPAHKPWITWVTQGRIPSAAKAGPQDRLLVAEEQWIKAAVEAGWRGDRVAAAGWPLAAVPAAAGDAAPVAALLSNTRAIDPSPEMELSSHRLLWEAILKELTADPLAVARDAAAYLADRRGRMNISAEGFDATRFLRELIVPAYEQALARRLIAAGVPLQLWGGGWDELEELKPAWTGALSTRERFLAAVASAKVLVHPRPEAERGEIDALGRPVLRPPGRRIESFLAEARRLLREKPPILSDNHATLSAHLL